MSEKRRSSDAVEWAYDRYVKGNPDMEEYFEDLEVRSVLSQQIYDIRNKLHMTREDLAEFSGLSQQAIEDLEETDYEGDWGEAVNQINRAFHHWFTTVILPAAQMSPDDYSVKTVSA